MCEFSILNTQKKYEKHKNVDNFSTLLSATFLGFINNLWLSLALANLTKQINIISLLAADSENEKQMPTGVVQFDELLVKCKMHMICIPVARMMIMRLTEFSNGIRVMQRFVFQLKQSITDLGEAKKLRGDSHDTHIVKSKWSCHSRSSTFSTSSGKFKLIKAMAKAAALDVKAKFF